MKDDLISRQAAIELVKRYLVDCHVEDADWHGNGIEYELKNLPPAQQWLPVTEMLPEPLTDKEQRIFLAAMNREEKVCEQVDEECRNCREPYEDSLMRVCKEIRRKVKGALWT